MIEDKDIQVERTEKKSDSSKVGVAIIKYGAYLIIFFGVIWLLINYVFPLI